MKQITHRHTYTHKEEKTMSYIELISPTVIWKNLSVKKEEREGGAEKEVGRIKIRGWSVYQ